MKKRYQHIKGEVTYLTKRNKVIYQNSISGLSGIYLKVKKMSIKSFFSITARLFREQIHQFIKIDSEYDLVVLKNRMVLYKNKIVHDVIYYEDGKRPLRNGITIYKGKIYYSEYFGNLKRIPINLYVYDIVRKSKEVLHTFSNIRHIHFISLNLYDNSQLYIGTGDNNAECSIVLYDLSDNSIKIIGKGSQKWRSVSVLQTNNSIIWGSDDPVGDNAIYEYLFDNDRLIKHINIEGPAYYSTRDKNNNLYIATTVENPKIHKCIIYKYEDNSWKIYKKFKKDIFSPKYFGYGIIEFVLGQEHSSTLFFNKINIMKEVI